MKCRCRKSFKAVNDHIIFSFEKVGSIRQFTPCLLIELENMRGSREHYN